MRSIKGLLLTAGLVFSVGLSLSVYGVVSALGERSVREEAVEGATGLADLTFATMFELMRTGWSRAQLEAFVAATQKSMGAGTRQIDIHRGEKVSALFGPIAQKPADEAMGRAIAERRTQRIDEGDVVRVVQPLLAEPVCLKCHTNTATGDVLGVIDVRQDVGPRIAAQGERLRIAFAPIVPIALAATLAMVLFIRRRLKRSIDSLAASIGAVNKLADLRVLEARVGKGGFHEFDAVVKEVGRLTQRVRSIAVDRDMLEFEIRLLEKFVLSSDVIRDWRDYVNRLLVEIDGVTPSYAMFSLFQVDGADYDLQVFWRHRPSESTRRRFEERLHQILRKSPDFEPECTMHVHHSFASAQPAMAEVDVDVDQIELQIKSLVFGTPKIGGIVGVGMHPHPDTDEMRLLVVESILATLLNVVGSVKAIDKYTKDLEYYATRDPLTDLYNQRVFWELAEKEVSRSARHGQPFSLLMIDADNFKSINDTYGHAVGDEFLQQVVAGISSAVRDDDMLARYGGDEFTVILPQTGLAAAHTVALRVIDAITRVSLKAPDGSSIGSSVSVGIAAYPEHATTARDLFLFADNMMYRAKSEGKNRVLLPAPEDVVDVFRTLGEKSMLILGAIEQRRVLPYYQPIVDVSTGRVEALEVLSRIRTDDGRTIAAEEYVAIAEKMGVMHKLDFIQLDKALADVSRSGYQGLLFINMSPRALVLNDFVLQASRIAREHGIDPGRLVFEITERETIKNMSLLDRFISALRAEGFKLAIDDFGSGFSSFHYVKRFAIDFLKIEGDFIVGMAHNERDRALVRSIVALGRDLGIRTVAEYVEDPALLELVREQGIDLAQGFHIQRPSASIEVAVQAAAAIEAARAAGHLAHH